MSRRVDHIAVTHSTTTKCPATPTAYKLFNFASASTSGVHHHGTTAPRLAPHPATALPEPGAGGADGEIMDLDADMIPTSPSADSSPSSSDLDTESTGSFFPDRSTTLGTLMGVSAFGERRGARTPAAAAGEDAAEEAQRAAPDREDQGRGVGVWRRRRRRKRRQRGRSLGGSWWRLCRDHGDGGGPPPTSLGEFLDMERQLAGADFLCDDGTGASGRETAAAVAASATALFEDDGRVRPPQPQPATAEERGRWRLLLRASEGSSSTSSLARLPVLLTGICSGGAG